MHKKTNKKNLEIAAILENKSENFTSKDIPLEPSQEFLQAFKEISLEQEKSSNS